MTRPLEPGGRGGAFRWVTVPRFAALRRGHSSGDRRCHPGRTREDKDGLDRPAGRAGSNIGGSIGVVILILIWVVMVGNFVDFTSAAFDVFGLR